MPQHLGGALRFMACLVACLLACQGAGRCAGGNYANTAHGNSQSGVQRTTMSPNGVAGYPRGSCIHCHEQHASVDGSAYTPRAFGLFSANDNTLCATCHPGGGTSASFQDASKYNLSSHGTPSSSGTVWPGTLWGGPAARDYTDGGRCLNCHDPHGWADGSGLIPSMLVGREENLCFACHDGSKTPKNVKNDFVTKTFTHPVTAVSGRHQQVEGLMNSDSFRQYFGGANRHVECVDCHNPHVDSTQSTRDLAGAGATGPSNAASTLISGVSYLEVGNGAAGSVPSYTPRPASYPTPITYEYQLCFKCHSSWGWNGITPTTTYPNGLAGADASDPSVAFNPANLSHHAVEGPGNNYGNGGQGAPVFPNGSPFVSPVTSTSTLWCSDCHGSDTAGAASSPTSVKGPHGSNQRYILRKFYNSSRGSWSTVFCYNCHDMTVYGYSDGVSDASWVEPTAPARSRFPHPLESGNRQVSSNYYQIWCLNCHGGSPLGSIHGSNAPAGPGGTTPLGQSLMNGTMLDGWTRDAVGRTFTLHVSGAASNFGPAGTAHSEQASWNW